MSVTVPGVESDVFVSSVFGASAACIWEVRDRCN